MCVDLSANQSEQYTCSITISFALDIIRILILDCDKLNISVISRNPQNGSENCPTYLMGNQISVLLPLLKVL